MRTEPGNLSLAAFLLLAACTKSDATQERSGCSKDLDCKGARVCQNGQCVEPSRATAPASPAPSTPPDGSSPTPAPSTSGSSASGRARSGALNVCYKLQAAGVAYQCVAKGDLASTSNGLADAAGFRFTSPVYDQVGTPGLCASIRRSRFLREIDEGPAMQTRRPLRRLVGALAHR